MPGAAVAPGWPSLHLVVSLEAVAHKRLPVVALEGLGARVGVAHLHLLLLGHGLGVTLEAGGHERFALVTLLVPSLGAARLHALLLRAWFLLVGTGRDRRRSRYERHQRCPGRASRADHPGRFPLTRFPALGRAPIFLRRSLDRAGVYLQTFSLGMGCLFDPRFDDRVG